MEATWKALFHCYLLFLHRCCYQAGSHVHVLDVLNKEGSRTPKRSSKIEDLLEKGHYTLPSENGPGKRAHSPGGLSMGFKL